MSTRVAMAVGLTLGLAMAACREPCNEETCGGCCDASGECRLGTEKSACGRRGALCSACPEGGACARQVCVAPDGGSTDGGAGLRDGGCLVGECGQQVCNLQVGACEMGGACDAMAPQPGGCPGGQRCVAGACRDVERPSCANFPQTSAPLRWSPAVNFGPVISSARAVSFAVDDAGCPAGSARRAVVEVSAYDFRARFVDGGYPRLFQYRDNGTFGEVSPASVTMTATNGGANATLQLRSCGPESVLALSVGYAFEAGNGVCLMLTP